MIKPIFYYNTVKTVLYSSLHSFALINFACFSENIDLKRERRERVREWQKKFNNKDTSNEKDQQGNKSRLRKKVGKPSRGDKRRSNNSNQRDGDRDLHSQVFESDDYFEIPMDVESDSTGNDSLFH